MSTSFRFPIGLPQRDCNLLSISASELSRSPLVSLQGKQRLFGYFRQYSSSDRVPVVFSERPIIIVEALYRLPSLLRGQFVKECASIGLVSLSSCLQATESLLPSGQAGRRASVNRLAQVACSCRSNWGKPKRNQASGKLPFYA